MLLQIAEQREQRRVRRCSLQTLSSKPCSGTDQNPIAELLTTINWNRMKRQRKHCGHLTSTGKQNGLIRIEHPEQQPCGKSLKRVTNGREQGLCIDAWGARQAREPFAHQLLLQRHRWMQSTATNQCLNRQPKPRQHGQGCGGAARNTFRQQQWTTQSLPKTPTTIQKLLHPFGLHRTAAGDATSRTGTWIFKAEMGELR